MLTLLPSDYAGRSNAACGGIYIVAALLWLWLGEGHRPDAWNLTGGMVACWQRLSYCFHPNSVARSHVPSVSVPRRRRSTSPAAPSCRSDPMLTEKGPRCRAIASTNPLCRGIRAHPEFVGQRTARITTKPLLAASGSRTERSSPRGSHTHGADPSSTPSGIDRGHDLKRPSIADATAVFSLGSSFR
ncbi:hypothetical protein [Mesorhizobium sp. M0862]|uniref:hypothetical protein n=1 Tax=Mesorhizobium sp. M0862 TaxID=2957015 RepID=UPI00333603BA